MPKESENFKEKKMTNAEWRKKSKDFKENILKNKIEDRWQKEIQRLQGEEIDERSTKMTIEETIGVAFSRAAKPRGTEDSQQLGRTIWLKPGLVIYGAPKSP